MIGSESVGSSSVSGGVEGQFRACGDLDAEFVEVLFDLEFEETLFDVEITNPEEVSE